MGKMSGHRQVSLYVDPELYERVRCTAYSMNEDIYEFVDEALRSAVERRPSKELRVAIESQVKSNRDNKRRATRHRGG